jgi:murein DD-endopeptidase MepM/ murein hydrolase activator NlpD
VSWYGYCGGNPIGYIDPFGLYPKDGDSFHREKPKSTSSGYTGSMVALEKTGELPPKSDRSGSAAARELTGEIPNMETFIYPIKTGSLTSVVGEYNYINPNTGKLVQKPHRALDFGAPQGTAIIASASGEVTEVGLNTDAYGYSITIRHSNGLTTKYSHMMDTPYYNVGDSVKQGSQIGCVGNTSATGASIGNHVDFEVRLHGVRIDPFHVLGGLPIGITPSIKEGYVRINEYGGYENWLLPGK